jgi:hypothetical protein
VAGALFLGVEAPIAELGDCHDPAVRAATQHGGS